MIYIGNDQPSNLATKIKSYSLLSMEPGILDTYTGLINQSERCAIINNFEKIMLRNFTSKC
jgi:hypothetical protein